jgi:hypothetical protein
LESARDWLHSCLMTHDICPKPDEKFMPTRLIAISNVGGSDHLSLLECSDPEPYATLSYCWGNKKQVTTITANLQQHKSNLYFKDLPETVKDAIKVASKLGFRRLWIDSLCIIQDDDDDKAREISKMPLIYSQATITIAASHANSVHDGFLGDRTPLRQYFQLPYLCLIEQELQEGSITLYRGRYEEYEQPLESRGWAFQERLLSPRILDYRSHHTEWVCHEHKAGRKLTDGNFDFALCPFMSDDFSMFSEAIIEKGDTLSGKSTPSTVEKIGIDKYLQIWYQLVGKYTLRDLTVLSDRILAISAVAARFQPFLNDEYCAGHWKAQLNKELLWKSYRSGGGPEPRPSEYQAPSWSWASISGPIDITSGINLSSDGKQRDDCFKILDCQIQLRREESSNSTEVYQFGAVRSGTLVVTGKIQQAELWCTWDDIYHIPEFRVRKYDPRNGSAEYSSVKIKCDALEAEFTKQRDGSIPIVLLRIVQDPYPAGLVLRQTAPSVYSRIGFFSIPWGEIGPRSGDWFQEEIESRHNESEIRTISIV